MSRLKDETGNLYGKWTVLRKDPNKNSSGEVCWICKCQCGNIKSVSGKVLRRGKSKSCGLCNKKIIQIGDKFEDLTVIKKGDVQNSHRNWICKCSCGKIVSVRGSNLISGNTKSCGHNFPRTRLSLLGKKFGLLTVIQDMGNDNYGNSQWKCKCECGNIKIIKGGNLTSGNTITCGCGIMSKGQFLIKKVLDTYNIKYIKEFIPKDLKKYRFDFAILSNDKIIRLIEFDGIQHFEEWNRDKKDTLSNRQQRDSLKNEWAKNKQIPLVRIPYWEIQNINYNLLFQDDKYLVS